MDQLFLGSLGVCIIYKPIFWVGLGCCTKVVVMGGGLWCMIVTSPFLVIEPP